MNRRQRRRAERAARKRRNTNAQSKSHRAGDQHAGTAVPNGKQGQARGPLRWLGAILAALTIVSIAYQFRPEINVERDVSLNVRDPFATQFRVTNQGLLPVYDLNFSCTVYNPMMFNVTTEGNSGQEPVPVLESKESTTKNCSIRAESFPLLSDLFFTVTYQPKWYWRRQTKKARFVNMRDAQGNLEWVKQPTDSR